MLGIDKMKNDRNRSFALTICKYGTAYFLFTIIFHLFGYFGTVAMRIETVLWFLWEFLVGIFRFATPALAVIIWLISGFYFFKKDKTNYRILLTSSIMAVAAICTILLTDWLFYIETNK